MYSSNCYNILSSILTPRYVILLRLRLVYDLFLLFRTQKDIQKQEKRVAKWICFANTLF